MSQVDFNYKGIITSIQCNKNEKMKDICKKFLTKIGKEINNLFFIYSSQILNDELTFEQCSNSEDKKRNKMSILVYSINETSYYDLFPSIIKSKEIICPECGEICKIKIKDYKVTLFECKNNHKINNIFLNKFDYTQNIDQSKIVCNICKKNNKSNTYNNLFYRCGLCKINICPLCKTNHNQTHLLIYYDLKNYICNIHNEPFISYCQNCKNNMCMLCEKEHFNHKIIYFGKIMPNVDYLKIKLNELKNTIDKFNENIKSIINILNNVMENLEKYFKLCNDIINNFENKYRNYETINNLNEIIKNDIIQDLMKVINDNNIKNKFNNIFDIYNMMNSEEIINEINIIYKINKYDEHIKIFGETFVKNNKNNCKILFEGNEYELQECFDIRNYKNKEKLEITLIGINNITDMSFMFSDCTSLLSLPDLPKWNIRNVTNMYKLFGNCSSLISLADISKWNTSLVKDMSLMFYKCSSLKSLPDISEWDIKNVNNIYQMFDECTSLLSLPDISKWNVTNVSSIGWMFCKCSSLVSLPDISKWNTSNVTNMEGLFEECSSLVSLPDISKWNTKKVTDMSSMFKKCTSLSSLPDISKWDINNVKEMVDMFSECNESLQIPSKFLLL